MCDFSEFPLLICHSLLKLGRLDIVEGDLILILTNSTAHDRRKYCGKYIVEWQDIINPVTQARST